RDEYIFLPLNKIKSLMTNQHIPIAGLIVLLVALPFLTQAQTTVGIRAGANFSNVHFVNADGTHQHTEMIPRLQAGLTIDIPLAMGLYLQPAAMYVGKGFKQDGGWLAEADNESRAAAAYVE